MPIINDFDNKLCNYWAQIAMCADLVHTVTIWPVIVVTAVYCPVPVVSFPANEIPLEHDNIQSVKKHLLKAAN